MSQPPNEITVPIAEAVSDTLETPIEELPSLVDTIDLDAVESLVPSTATTGDPHVAVSFTYANLRIWVYSGNTVYVRPTDNESGCLENMCQS